MLQPLPVDSGAVCGRCFKYRNLLLAIAAQDSNLPVDYRLAVLIAIAAAAGACQRHSEAHLPAGQNILSALAGSLEHVSESSMSRNRCL